MKECNCVECSCRESEELRQIMEKQAEAFWESIRKNKDEDGEE